MRVVARLIGANATLGVKRQVFFVSLGGFDNHNSLMGDHPRLMTQLDGAMRAFYAATVELGVAHKVTTFTASDFGRTLASNCRWLGSRLGFASFRDGRRGERRPVLRNRAACVHADR